MLNDLEKKHRELEQKNRKLVAELEQLNYRLNSLLTSSTWRYTAPLRFIANYIKTFLKKVKCIKIIAKPLYKKEKYYSIYDRNNYIEWIQQYDKVSDETRLSLQNTINNMENKPLISVLLPTYNPKAKWLKEAIDSVIKQIYPYWELCIADDASTDNNIRSILEYYARQDPRIKVVFRSQNGHISAASNSALELVTSEWVTLLDHDDLLNEQALFWVAEAINHSPGVKLIYSDEDKIHEKGKRSDPHFKSDWNVDLFYSHNMVSHLGVYSFCLLKKIGGFSDEMVGSQDYDLALRCIEHIEAKQILHIPRVLYHWRMHDESTSKDFDNKPYAMLAGQRALNEHFKRQGMRAEAEITNQGFRVHYALPENAPLVSLIIPTRNSYKLIQNCVESILAKTTYQNYEIIIIDNGSDDPLTLQYFREIELNPIVRILRDDRPFNYSALNNSAVKEALGEFICLLNNDIEVISPDWLSEMVSLAYQPKVGAVGARLWYPDNTLQHGGVILGMGGVANHAHKKLPRYQNGYFSRASLIQAMSAVTGACLLIRKKIYEEAGGLNESELQIAFNDIDFCLRLGKLGYRNIWTPYAELYHHESATRGHDDDSLEKMQRLIREADYMKQIWGELLFNDPYYNPNLTLDHHDFSLSWPPRNLDKHLAKS